MSPPEPVPDGRTRGSSARRTWVQAAGLVLLALSVTIVAACSSGEVGPKPTDPQLALGWQVYKDHCATCHGTTGGGGAGPKLAGTVVADFPNIGDQITIIENGKGGGAMPAWKGSLSSEEIEAVAQYTRKCLGKDSC